MIMTQADNVYANLYCVILAGGVGRRFWPYSRKSYPKQFLDFFNTGESLLQMTYRRMQRCISPDRILVATNIQYEEIVRKQLPNLPMENVLCESQNRNTASSIAYATRHIHAINPDAVVVITPSDHLVTDDPSFHTLIGEAAQYASCTEMIVTLGIKPTYPEVGYGYIQALESPVEDGGEMLSHCYPVKTFIEKPNSEMARILVDSGEFYWNAGLFVAMTSVLIDEVKSHAPEIAERLYSKPEVWGTARETIYVHEVFPYCPNISFDYAVMEKSQKVLMLVADMGWTDVGTWSATYQLTDKDQNANATIGAHQTIYNDSRSNLVAINDPEKLVVLQGIDSMLVVETDDVLLICRRGEEDKLRQVVAEAHGLNEKYTD